LRAPPRWPAGAPRSPGAARCRAPVTTDGRGRAPSAKYGTGAVQRSTETGVAVVGGGAAGLYVALRAAEHGAEVTLVSRKPLAESASYWAQGGLAAALAPDDSPARH